MHEELIAHARKVQACVHIAAEPECARDVADTLDKLIVALHNSEVCHHVNLQRTNGYHTWRCSTCDKLFVVREGTTKEV